MRCGVARAPPFPPPVPRRAALLTLLVLSACATPPRPAEETDDLLDTDTTSGPALPSCFQGGTCVKDLPLSGGVSCRVHATAYESGACLVEVDRRPPSLTEKNPQRQVIDCNARQTVCEQSFLCDCAVMLPERPCTGEVYARRIAKTLDDGRACEAVIQPPDLGSCEVRAAKDSAPAGPGRIRLGETGTVCGARIPCGCPTFQKPASPPPPSAPDAPDAGAP